MKIILLNWAKGSNDAFTFGNEMYIRYFKENGKPSRVVDLEDPNLLNILQHEKGTGIDFVLTIQGIGSNAMITPPGQETVSLWNSLQVPLICVHADHPSFMPDHHRLESPFCRHLYYDEDACLFSNTYFRTENSASLLDMLPMDIYLPSSRALDGACFVVMKNIQHPDEMVAHWKQTFNKDIFDFFIPVVEQMKALILTQEDFVDFHYMLEAAIAAHPAMHVIHQKPNQLLLFELHRLLDSYARNFKSIELVSRLKDYPVRIYGRGWDSIRAKGNPKHEFFDGLSARESQKLYYSEYGILDVSPFRRFHDRSIRAMANHTAFLSNADIKHTFPNYDAYSALFYNFLEGDVEARCERIMSNPARHRDLSRAFSIEYQAFNKAAEYVNALSSVAQAMRKT